MLAGGLPSLGISVDSGPRHAPHSPSLAISSRIPPPPTSKTTLPTGTRHAQWSNAPFPLPIRVSLPLTHTGTSGKTRIQHSAPLTALILRLMATSADWSCLAVSRVEERTRKPKAPSWRVVPLVEPPVGSWGGARGV